MKVRSAMWKQQRDQLHVSQDDLPLRVEQTGEHPLKTNYFRSGKGAAALAGLLSRSNSGKINLE
jgi:hypothetical protein